MDNFLRNLDATNVIRDNLPKIIEVFIEFYGEEYRDLITEKLNNTIILGYYNSETLFSLIYDEKQKMFNEIIADIFDELGIEKTKENEEKYFGNNNNFDYENIIPIFKFINYIEVLKKEPKELIENEYKEVYEFFLKYIPDLTYEDFYNRNFSLEQMNLLPGYVQNNLNNYYDINIDDILKSAKPSDIKSIIKIHPGATEDNIDELIKKGELDYLLEQGSVFKDGLAKYKYILERDLKKYIDLEKQLKQYENKIDEKYFMQALLEFKDYLSLNDQAKIDEMIVRNSFSWYNIEGLKCVFSNSIYGQRTIDYFDEKNDKKLDDFDVDDYIKNTIMRNRIKYFRYKGIDLGDNYLDYVNNPECKKIWPKYEEIEKIKERFNYYLNESNIEKYSNNPFYKQAIKESREKGLLVNENMFEASAFTQKKTCVYPNFIKKNGQNELYSIVAVYSDADAYMDNKIIHELNHVIELAISEIKDNHYSLICGWDFVSGSIEQEEITKEDTINKDREKRDYELFSEIINELLSQKVIKLMHQKDLFVLSDKSNYQDTGGTSYEFSLFLVREFFETYMDDIIASRKNNNIKIIWDKVGKENFDRLNELFHEFYECFPEFTFYKLLNDIRDNKNTELVQKFNSISDRRDKVLQAMKEYSMSSKTL